MVPNKVCVECSFINFCFRFKVINKKNGKENLAVYQKSLGALFQAKGASDWFKKISLAVQQGKAQSRSGLSDMSPVRNFSSRFSDVIDSVELQDVGSFLWLSIIIIDDIALQLTFSVNT